MASLSLETDLIKRLAVLLLVIVYATSHPLDEPDPPSTASPLLIISFDGFRWNYLERTSTPNFNRFKEEGVYARRGLKNAFITKTFPNHFTLATGLWEESHGIIANDMYDPVLNQTFTPKNVSANRDPAWFDVGAEPIWVTNQLQTRNGRSGIIMWPGGGAPVKYVRASHNIMYNTVMKNESKIDTVLDWFLQDNPINLGLVYFNQPDSFAHWFGPEAPQVTRMIGGLDKVIGYLLKKLEAKGLLDKMNVIITSDHGFSETPHRKTINLDDYVEPSLYFSLLITPVACLNPFEGKLEEVYAALKKGAAENGHFIVYKREEIPEHFHYTHNRRICPILVLADDTYSFETAKQIYKNKGDHGYDNDQQDMHPFFLARGPDFKKNFSVDSFLSVDVYPLMCHLLNLVPAPNNGSLDIVSQLVSSPKQGSSSSSSVTVYTYVVAIMIITVVASAYGIAVWRYQRFLRRRQLVQDVTSRAGHRASASADRTSASDETKPMLAADSEELSVTWDADRPAVG